jgi:hypothetical protein
MSSNYEMDTYMCGHDESIFGSLYYNGIEETIPIPFVLVQNIAMENTGNY